MNLREYAEQAIPLLQAVLEGKALEFRPRLRLGNRVPQWEPLTDLPRADHFNLIQFEVRVKPEAPDVVTVHVYESGETGIAYGPKETVPSLAKGRAVRYVREDLVVWPAQQRASSPPAEELEAEQPDAPSYPRSTRRVLTLSGMVDVTGPKPAVDDHIAFVERNRGR